MYVISALPVSGKFNVGNDRQIQIQSLLELQQVPVKNPGNNAAALNGNRMNLEVIN